MGHSRGVPVKGELHLVVRIYIRGRKVLKELIDAPEDELDQRVRHVVDTFLMISPGLEPHVVEVENLDEPDQNERFFRFGTDPDGMVMPAEFWLKQWG